MIISSFIFNVIDYIHLHEIIYTYMRLYTLT